MGIVENTVKVPQGLLNMPLTTAMERPAKVRIRMKRIATEATVLPDGLADFILGYFCQALTFVPDGGKEHHHVMHGTGYHSADYDPQSARQIAELGGQDRPYKRARRGDGRE